MEERGEENGKGPTRNRASRNRLRVATIGLILVWTFFFNLLIKEQSLSDSFFLILDTISDDFVLGAATTIFVGILIVLLFSATKLYTQVISNVYSFRIIEDLVHGLLLQGRVKEFGSKLMHFEDLEDPETVCPVRASSLLLSFSFIYVMSWIYVLLFSEALFFVSWSAGVDLEISKETLLLLPTLALAIPFSARVMAYLRYPYAQDYADFMPGAVFVLVLVTALGKLFKSDDQQFFLRRAWEDPAQRLDLLRNGVFLAFIPVFFEGIFWLLELSREDDQDPGEPA